MNHRIKHITIRLAAALTAVSLLTTAAFAEEPTESAETHPDYEATNSYILSFGDGAQPYLYGSRYECKHSYNDPAAGENSVWTYWNAPEVFNLVNTATNESIAAYCTDADTSARETFNYRRINLDDSTYHESGAAQRLRAVVLNSFPHISVAEVAAAANAELGEGSIQDLTQGEVISATQQAIWEITHGSKYTVDDNYVSVRDMSSYDPSEFVYPESLDGCIESEYTSANIENLYNYFLAMKGEDAEEAAVSGASFVSWNTVSAQEEDGSYTITVNTTVDVTMSSNDAMTLSAVMGGKVIDTQALKNGTNEITGWQLTGLSESDINQPVTLAIDGTQTVADVFLFDADGDRTVSQSMVGYSDSQLPVHAEVNAEPERKMHFLKQSKNEITNADGTTSVVQKPLEGITFDIYLAATLDDYLSGTEQLPDLENVSDDLSVFGAAVGSVTTDENGKATFSLTKNDLPDGVYLIVERAHPLIEEPVAPFYVMLPMTNPDGTGWLYEITINPKNVVKGEIEIEKDVIELGNNEATVAAGTPHTWIISASIPEDIASGKEYIITDTLDNRLDYMGNLTVKVEHANGITESPVVLTVDTDYILTVTNNDSAADKKSDAFTIALTAAGRKKVSDAVSAAAVACEIRVYFDAQINANAGLGEKIPNQATLDYTNSVNFEYDAESDIPEVYTGGLKVEKVDGLDQTTPLDGAEFKLARMATPEEIATFNDSEIPAEEKPALEYLMIGETSCAVIYVDFYATSSLSGQWGNTIVTGKDGLAYFYGVPYGTYYLVETKAPAGYNLLSTPVEITIGYNGNAEVDHTLATATQQVLNFGGLELPETGGMGTTIFYTLGGMLMAGAAILLITKKKMANAE